MNTSKNSILVFMDGETCRHRFCSESDGRKYLAKVADESGNASLIVTDVADAETAYTVHSGVRARVDAEKASVVRNNRVKLALDKEKVPMERDLRLAIHRAINQLGCTGVPA